LNLVVQTVLKVVICLLCHQPILPPSGIPEHVNRHIHELRPSQNIADTLIERFSLGDVVCYPSQPIDPVFGIPLLEDPHYFCDECHFGFHRLTGVQTHQASDRCNGQSYHQGYGQLIPGSNRHIIEINIDTLKKKDDIQLDHTGWFRQGITPTRDYSKIPVPVPENRSNLSSFFNRDGWLDHVKDYTPQDLFEARRMHQDDEKHGEDLRKAALRYISGIQDKIQANVVFGLMKNIGSTDE
jgi:transposase-like protein